jgi:hypothetical protein
MSRPRWVQVRDQLADRLGDEPGCRLVDIGLDEDGVTVVVRVHLTPGASLSQQLPDEVAGLPVRVIRGDYRTQ